MESCKKLELEQDINRIYRGLHALAHPTRLKIICAIHQQEQTVTGIAKFVGSSPSNISQQLAKLYDLKLLRRRRNKNRTYYSLKDDQIVKIIDAIDQNTAAT